MAPDVTLAVCVCVLARLYINAFSHLGFSLSLPVLCSLLTRSLAAFCIFLRFFFIAHRLNYLFVVEISRKKATLVTKLCEQKNEHRLWQCEPQRRRWRWQKRGSRKRIGSSSRSEAWRWGLRVAKSGRQLCEGFSQRHVVV